MASTEGSHAARHSVTSPLHELLLRLAPLLYPDGWTTRLQDLAEPGVLEHKYRGALDTASELIDSHVQVHRVPHPVTATVLLNSALLFYHDFIRAQAGATLTKTAHLSLAAGLLKTVSGFTDPLQPYFPGASMIEIAQQLGLPTEWVVLRHAIAHDSLPDLQLLVQSCEDARLWIADVFWSKLTEQSTDLQWVDPLILSKPRSQQGHQSEADVRAKIKSNLKHYKSNRLAHLRQSDTTDHRASASLPWIQNLGGTGGSMFVVDALVQPAMLIPSSTSVSPEQMELAFSLWDPLLDELNRKDHSFLKSLVGALLSSLPAATSQDQPSAWTEACQFWLEHLNVSETQHRLIQLRQTTHPSPWIVKTGKESRHNGWSNGDTIVNEVGPTLAAAFVYGRDEWLDGFDAVGEGATETDTNMFALDQTLREREQWLNRCLGTTPIS